MPRTKMDVSQRAKQFLPFQAVRGLKEALEEAEKEVNLSFINEVSCDTIDEDYLVED
ncbi:MAG: hypothetical protein MJZ11_01975 [Lachnospiraceae bacterium]|nr:hypothetical protein [Lachnospiraceae bacterium]